MDENFIDDNELINQAKEKRVLILMIVDTAKLMKVKMSEVNSAIENCIKKMKTLDKEHNIAKVAINILEYNKEAKWKMNNPVEISNYNFTELKATDYAESQYSQFYNELNDKLEESKYLKDAHDYHPIILLISNGQPTDDYFDSLDICEENQWFHHATRIALPIITDKQMTEEKFRTSFYYEAMMDFTGQHADRIFHVSHIADLASMLEIVTMTTIGHKTKIKDENIDDDDPFFDIRQKIWKI